MYGVHPASYYMVTEGINVVVKQLGYDVDHSPSSSIEAKNEWSYGTTPPYLHTPPCLAEGQYYFAHG